MITLILKQDKCMNITLIRKYKLPTYTIGKLYIDGEYFCDTLEDKDRGLTDSMFVSEISKIKIKKETAIPTGTYKVTITYSNRFKKNMPLINDVKGFEGIRIHSGNTNQDTEGCVLVGFNKVKGNVINSRDTYNKLFSVLSKSNNITITIK